MKLGISTAAYYGCLETEEAASAISKLPCDTAEVFLQSDSEYTVPFAEQVFYSLGGVPCSSIHPLGTAFENGMFSRSARQRQDAMSKYQHILDAAVKLKARYYVYHGRNTAQLTPLPFNAQHNADVLGPMCEEAKERGLIVAWENVFWCQLSTPDRVHRMRSLLPQVRFTLDIKQAMRAGFDALQFVQAMGDALVNVHLCDWAEDGTLALPGKGCVHFERLFTALKQANYEGPLIWEPYARQIQNPDQIEQSLHYLRERLNAV